MAKDAYYFSHDSNARNDNKLLSVRMTHGAEGYGIYFMLLEKLRECADYKCVKDYNVIAFDLRVDASKVQSIVEDFGLFLFTDDGEYIYSESFTQRMIKKDDISRKRSAYGKKGMGARYEQQNANKTITNVLQTDNKTLTNEQQTSNIKEKESKEKESKENKENKETNPIGLAKKGELSLSQAPDLLKSEEGTQSPNGVDTVDQPKVSDTVRDKREQAIRNRKKRMRAFHQTLLPYTPRYGAEMVRAFFEYRTEPNKSGSQMRAILPRAPA